MVKYALLWYSGLCRLKIWWLTWVRLGTKGLKYPLCTWMQLRFYCLDPQKQKAFCPTEKTSIAFIYWLANFPARIKKVYRLWTRGDSVDSSIIVFFSSVFCNNIRLVSDTRRKRSESSPPRRPDRPERRRRLPTAEASDLLRLIHAAVNQPRSDTNKEEARSDSGQIYCDSDCFSDFSLYYTIRSSCCSGFAWGRLMWSDAHHSFHLSDDEDEGRRSNVSRF